MSLEVRVYTIDEDGQRRTARGIDFVSNPRLKAGGFATHPKAATLGCPTFTPRVSKPLRAMFAEAFTSA